MNVRWLAAVSIAATVSVGADAVGQVGVYRYTCEGNGQTSTVTVDEARNTLEWAGRAYTISRAEDCGRYGWRAERGAASFEFCTATKGYAGFDVNGVSYNCQQAATGSDGASGHSSSSAATPLDGDRQKAVNQRQSISDRPVGRGPFECTEPFYRRHQCEPMRPAEWTALSSDNGQTVYVDVASVKFRRDLVPPFTDEHGKTGTVARALVYFEDGMPIGASNAGWYDIDCDGPYLLGQAGVFHRMPAQFLPPKSVGFQIRAIACGAAPSSPN